MLGGVLVRLGRFSCSSWTLPASGALMTSDPWAVKQHRCLRDKHRQVLQVLQDRAHLGVNCFCFKYFYYCFYQIYEYCSFCSIRPQRWIRSNLSFLLTSAFLTVKHPSYASVLVFGSLINMMKLFIRLSSRLWLGHCKGRIQERFAAVWNV